MSMIRVTDLTFAYPGSYDNIFEHASFQFDTDWKLGFTGRNGRGKTTFLRLLAGELPHGGAIAGEVPCGYFPPPVKDGSRLALEVMAAACPEAEEWEFLREAHHAVCGARRGTLPPVSSSCEKRRRGVPGTSFVSD